MKTEMPYSKDRESMNGHQKRRFDRLDRIYAEKFAQSYEVKIENFVEGLDVTFSMEWDDGLDFSIYSYRFYANKNCKDKKKIKSIASALNSINDNTVLDLLRETKPAVKYGKDIRQFMSDCDKLAKDTGCKKLHESNRFFDENFPVRWETYFKERNKDRVWNLRLKKKKLKSRK